MSESEKTHGLACPHCGGMIPIPEGEIIVRCPYCDLRSMVRGERGIQRFQVPLRIDHSRAVGALHTFLAGKRNIAFNTASQARLLEDFVAYIPFWTGWARVLGWVFGQKRVRSDKTTTYEPREVKVTQEMIWNGAACDVGEFGVNTVPLTDQPLDPFDPNQLHTQGMVFEPVNAFSDARQAASDEFIQRVQTKANLDRIAQVFVRFIRQHMGLVYYPLWVMRYVFRGRTYQVVVDGYSGKVLYGKAPGNSLYRAAVLIAGMAAGAFMVVDIPSLALYLLSQSQGDGIAWLAGIGLASFLAGCGLIVAAYRAFRYGEEYEFRAGGKPAGLSILSLKDLSSQVEDLTSWIDQLS